ncbi:hypothetical protein Tco_0052754 [Tanacetum coccineum]
MCTDGHVGAAGATSTPMLWSYSGHSTALKDLPTQAPDDPRDREEESRAAKEVSGQHHRGREAMTPSGRKVTPLLTRSGKGGSASLTGLSEHSRDEQGIAHNRGAGTALALLTAQGGGAGRVSGLLGVWGWFAGGGWVGLVVCVWRGWGVGGALCVCGFACGMFMFGLAGVVSVCSSGVCVGRVGVVRWMLWAIMLVCAVQGFCND